MTPKERAVMQQALEALEQYHYTLISAGVLDKQHVLNQGFTAHAALREVLAEPDIEEMTLTQIAARHEQAEQEPVAWMHKDGCVCSAYDKEHMFGLDYFNIPLYAAPVRTKDLTDAEFEWLVVDTLETWNSKDTMKDFARAVIAKFKEKNK